MKEHCDVLTREKKDRRLLSHVPDASGVRSHRDRRRGNGGGRGLRILVPISGKMLRDGAISWIMKLPSV